MNFGLGRRIHRLPFRILYGRWSFAGPLTAYYDSEPCEPEARGKIESFGHLDNIGHIGLERIRAESLVATVLAALFIHHRIESFFR
jgi:hypothetical protein